MADDISALQAAVNTNSSDIAALIAAKSAPAAPAPPSLQPQIDALTEQLAADHAKAVAALAADAPPAPAPSTLTVSPASLLITLNQPFNETLSVSGGAAPYTFVSNLPGVEVDTNGGLTGTPTAIGFIVVTDSVGATVTVEASGA